MTSPQRPPLQVVNGSVATAQAMLTPTGVTGLNPKNCSAPSSPRTPAEERLRKRILRRNLKGESQLHRAAIKGSKSITRQLLQMELIDPNAADNAGYTALHEAANRGRLDVVKVLVMQGNATINTMGGVNELQESPLHDAARNGHFEVST